MVLTWNILNRLLLLFTKAADRLSEYKAGIRNCFHLYFVFIKVTTGMKKLFLIILSLSLFTACGKNKSPKQVAEEICDCFANARHISIPDPETGKAEDECSRMQVEARKRFGHSEKRRQYEQFLYGCISQLMKKSLKVK